MQVCELLLEKDVIVIGARNVACTARAGTAFFECSVHGVEDGAVLAHAEIVVGAPDGDLPISRPVMADGAWKLARLAFQIGENAIPAFGTQCIKFCSKEIFVIQGDNSARGFEKN